MTVVRTIPFARPWVTDGDRQAVEEVLHGDILTHGPQNHAFEEEFAQFVGEDAYCVGVQIRAHRLAPGSLVSVISAPLSSLTKNCDRCSLYPHPSRLSTVFAMTNDAERPGS